MWQKSHTDFCPYGQKSVPFLNTPKTLNLVIMPSSDTGTQLARESPTVSTSNLKCEWTGEQEAKMIELLTKIHQNNKLNKGFSKASWASIAKELKGTEGSTNVKTGKMCLSHYNALAKRYRDAKDLLKKSGAGWNEKTKMVELQPAIWDEMAKRKTGVNKRLGWFRRNRFPLFDTMGLLVDPGMAKGTGRVDSITPATHNDDDAGIDKEDDTSSGKSMSNGDSDLGSFDQNNSQHANESHLESADPTSTAQDIPRSGNKRPKSFTLKHPQTPDLDCHRSRSISCKPFQNQARKSAAQAGEEFIEGIDGIADKLITHMTKDTNTLASGTSAHPYDFLTSATQGLRKLVLPQAELYKAMDLLKNDVDYAKMFVGLEEKDLQLGWIEGKLAGD
ncbi:hypothetical protein DFH28DRAFT_975099 [Melampsora americana]|nr:hypothetical protein DFH28DRAFT_975099 [Melampsora americana]